MKPQTAAAESSMASSQQGGGGGGDPTVPSGSLRGGGGGRRGQQKDESPHVGEAAVPAEELELLRKFHSRLKSLARCVSSGQTALATLDASHCKMLPVNQ